MAQDSWNPTQYDKFKDQRSKPFFDLMSLVQVKPKMDIVDLGCGTGELTAELHAHTGAQSTVGIDSSQEMLAKARAVAKKIATTPAEAVAGLAANVTGSLRFEQGDISSWNRAGEKDGAYDLVFSNAALQWCDGHEELFGRIRRALRPGGQIALQMPMNQDYPTHTLARTMAREMASQLSSDFSIQDSMLSLGDYASLLYRLGFKDQQAFTRVYGHVLDTREGVIEWVKGTTLTRFKAELSSEAYDKFLNEYRTLLFKELAEPQLGQPFFYPFKRVFLWAQI